MHKSHSSLSNLTVKWMCTFASQRYKLPDLAFVRLFTMHLSELTTTPQQYSLHSTVTSRVVVGYSLGFVKNVPLLLNHSLFVLLPFPPTSEIRFICDTGENLFIIAAVLLLFLCNLQNNIPSIDIYPRPWLHTYYIQPPPPTLFYFIRRQLLCLSEFRIGLSDSMPLRVSLPKSHPSTTE